MQKGSKALADIRSSLLEMGYSQKMISLAIKDTKIATVQNVLNQILSKEAQYTSAIAKSNPYNDSMSEGSESDEEAENQDLKTMDPDSLNYVDSCIQAFSVRLRSKDPNWIILELSDQLKSLNFNTTEAAARVRSFLEAPGHFPKLEEYRTRLHSIINKILNGKVDKRFRLSFAELEVSLVLAFELHILRPTGMLNVITLYPKLCAKHMYKPNEEVLAKLEEYYKETIKEKGPELEEKVVDPEPIVEDEKAEEEGPFDIGKEMELNLAHLQDKEKEYCIICVQRVREIVLLPCCHFLTCTICSPKIYKCPVCNNRVEKNLQIFWS